MYNLHWGFSNINFFSFFRNSLADLNIDEHYDYHLYIVNSTLYIVHLLNSKFVPKYTFFTRGSAASSSAVPALRTLPSNRR